MGLPPLYQPSIVADAIFYVAEHPRQEIVVGDPGTMMLPAQKISPGLMYAFMLSFGFDGQRTIQPKPEDAPEQSLSTDLGLRYC